METENNRLIAEFMVPEWEILKKEDYSGGIEQKDLYIAAILCSNTIEFLRYNSSWGWLMPVVEKIESLNFGFEILGNYCKIIGANIQCSQSTKIESVYKAVIEFIKWYNENKTK